MANKAFNIPWTETPPPDRATGALTNRQSMITFTAAPVVVTTVWKVLGFASASLGESIPLAIVLSLLVGMLIYWQNASPGGTIREKVLGALFALLNSFAIAATVLGIDSVIP